MKKIKCYRSIVICILICVGVLSACGKQEENSYGSSDGSQRQVTVEEKESAEESSQSAEVKESEEKESGEGSTQPVEEKETEEESPQPEQEDLLLPEALPLEFSFLSGAGAWRTDMTVQRDGSFEGTYLDSNFGDRSKKYPGGTTYICEFHGKFGDIQQINDYTYSMTLEKIKLKHKKDKKWIKGGQRFIATDPYGISDGNKGAMGKKFLFYTPDTPRKELPEDFLMWWQGWSFDEEIPETLSCYGIYNKQNEYGFFSYE